ncbi:MAG: hypothetical protein AB8B85_21525 [Paracoccaceae bacterium]
MRPLRLLVLLTLVSLARPALAQDQAADIESLEACVLESAVNGHEADCVGLLSEDCELANTKYPTCIDYEHSIWTTMLWAFSNDYGGPVW